MYRTERELTHTKAMQGLTTQEPLCVGREHNSKPYAASCIQRTHTDSETGHSSHVNLVNREEVTTNSKPQRDSFTCQWFLSPHAIIRQPCGGESTVHLPQLQQVWGCDGDKAVTVDQERFAGLHDASGFKPHCRKTTN